MSEPPRAIDDETLKVGLLMESAVAHQKLAETHLDKLKTHTQELDGVVRDEIRRTLIEELQAVTAESERAAQSLRAVKRAANMRSFVWSTSIALLCTTIPGAITRWVLPSAQDIAMLRAQQSALSVNIARLEQQGGHIDWRRCGDAKRLCVRVDRKAPAYGESADFYVVKGY